MIGKKISFLLFGAFIFSSMHLCGQDLNYQDTRKKNESFAKLKVPNLRTDLASFTLAGISESVGSTDLKKIMPSEVTPNLIRFDNNGLKVSIQLAPFDTAGHKFQYDDKYVIKIDKKTYFGDYGYLPRTHISQISLVVDGKEVVLPPAAYSDLYNVRTSYNFRGEQKTATAIYISQTGHLMYLYLLSRQEKGSYEVTWIFQNGQYLRRVVDYDLL